MFVATEKKYYLIDEGLVDIFITAYVFDETTQKYYEIQPDIKARKIKEKSEEFLLKAKTESGRTYIFGKFKTFAEAKANLKKIKIIENEEKN